jgi:ubiquitin-protein ligase E3 C
MYIFYCSRVGRHKYINLVAKYYLHDRLKRQAAAFFHGLYEIIQPDLLTIFCAPEIQVLISGCQTGISIADLKRNSQYAGGYSSIDRHVARFWAVVAELEDRDLERLIKFVTSCQRPPSLGFVGLHPPFTIQRVDCADDARLPTASTCFNILKLPTYSSQRILKEKLLTSIRSGAGFDLS